MKVERMIALLSAAWFILTATACPAAQRAVAVVEEASAQPPYSSLKKSVVPTPPAVAWTPELASARTASQRRQDLLDRQLFEALTGYWLLNDTWPESADLLGQAGQLWLEPREGRQLTEQRTHDKGNTVLTLQLKPDSKLEIGYQLRDRQASPVPIWNLERDVLPYAEAVRVGYADAAQRNNGGPLPRPQLETELLHQSLCRSAKGVLCHFYALTGSLPTDWNQALEALDVLPVGYDVLPSTVESLLPDWGLLIEVDQTAKVVRWSWRSSSGRKIQSIQAIKLHADGGYTISGSYWEVGKAGDYAFQPIATLVPWALGTEG